MDDNKKTKKQLIEELNELRQRVTDLKVFETEIEQTRINQEKFTKAFLHSSIPIGITTLQEGRFVDISDSLLRFLGRRRNEVIGRTTREIGFITEEQRELFFKEFHKNGRVENLALKVKVKDGTLRHGLFNAVLISFNNETYLLSVMMDITESKQMEEAIRGSEVRYRSLFETSQDVIFIANQETERLISVNPAACRLYGYSEDEFLQMKFFDVSAEPEKTRTAVHDSVTKVGSRLHRKKDGTVFPVEIAISYFEMGGRSLHTAFIRDITERKQAEEEKKKLDVQSQQIQKAESLSRMAGAIAHHFNNQLCVVIGRLEMALGDLPQAAEPVQSLNIAMKAAGKASHMGGLLLTYLGQTMGKREPLDLSETCRRSLPILEAVVPVKILLKSDFSSPGPVISANANQVQQVLTNLASNAWEAMGDNRGTIYIGIQTVGPKDIPEQQRFPVGWQPQYKTYACLEVTDTGCGVSDKDIEQLFDPFFSSKDIGRGMGLAVVMGIIRVHGAVITVKSDLGRGSTFSVFFPVTGEQIPKQPSRAAMLPKVAPGGTVLLVEDEERLRKVAAMMLNRLGFAVIEAKDGLEAVEVFGQRQDEIRCVLCDLTMPNMNGWETLTALRRIACDVPVVLASGYAEAHVMAGDHDELPQAFLGKPYTMTALSDAVCEALADKKK